MFVSIRAPVNVEIFVAVSNKNGAVVSAAPFRRCRAFTRHLLQPAIRAGETHRLVPVYEWHFTRTAVSVNDCYMIHC